MLDIAVAYNRFKFLGFEFLTWLWYSIDGIDDKNSLIRSLTIGNRIVLENRKNNRIETITIKGDDAGLEEGLIALQKGAYVTEINLLYHEEENRWQFTLKGDSLSIHSIKHPDIGFYDPGENKDAYLFEKTYHYNKVVEIIDQLFTVFIKSRLDDNWTKTVVPKLKKMDFFIVFSVSPLFLFVLIFCSYFYSYEQHF